MMEKKIVWSEESSYRRATVRVWLSKWTARDMAGIYKTQNYLPKASKPRSSMQTSSLFSEHQMLIVEVLKLHCCG
jgi:hypothetical protein